jgi:hypothetical protein
MPFRSSIVVILLALGLAGGVRAQERTYNQEGFGLPALFVLNYPDAAADFEGRRVRMMTGQVIPEEPLAAHKQWLILPGTVLRPFQVPPRGIRVRLYNDRGARRRLLCTINVRYYRGRDGRSRPMYQLDSDNTGMWYGNTFKAFNKMLDAPPLMYRSNTDLPNGDGFYSYLKLQSSVGPVTIDSWTVDQGKNP